MSAQTHKALELLWSPIVQPLSLGPHGATTSYGLWTPQAITTVALITRGTGMSPLVGRSDPLVVTPPPVNVTQSDPQGGPIVPLAQITCLPPSHNSATNFVTLVTAFCWPSLGARLWPNRASVV
jgi:hypothetical protein